MINLHTQNIPILSNYFLGINRGWLANPLAVEISGWEIGITGRIWKVIPMEETIPIFFTLW